MKTIKYVVMALVLVMMPVMFVGCKKGSELSEGVALQIKQDYWDTYLQENQEDWLKTPEDLSLTSFGIYNGCVVIIVGDSQIAHTAIWECTIAGYTFSRRIYTPIITWKDGAFLELQEAYDQGLLNKKDIASAHKLFTKWEYR